MYTRDLNYIYILIDGNRTIFYVGITIDYQLREKEHKKKFGHNFTMIILFETRDREYGLKKEKRLIDNLTKAGFTMLNKKCGKRPKVISIQNILH